MSVSGFSPAPFLPVAALPEQPCCLIVEDQALIALSIEAYLEDVGYEAAGPFRSSAEALIWLETHTPQVAILDYSLAEGTCTALAHELLQRQIPFMIYSGHSRSRDVPGVFRNAPWLEKPCPRDEILTALRMLLTPTLRS
jgi:DNA-binding response OmpR family regulator